MSYLAGKLKHRITIQKGVDTVNANGGLIRSYEDIITVWSFKRQIGNYLLLIRSMNTEKFNNNSPISTDEFGVRYSAIKNIGKEFSDGFSNGFDSLEDLYPIKGDYFIFLKYKSTNNGRRYKINRVVRDDNHKELMIMQCTEVEESGLGAPE